MLTRQRTLAAICCLAALSSCGGPLSTLAPQGPAALAIADLWWAMLAGSAAIFLGTMTLFFLAFRARSERPSSTRLWIVGLGIVFPTTVLVSLLVHGLFVGERLQPVAAVNVTQVEAVGRQWEWGFRQVRADGRGPETIGVMHIPAGRPVDVLVRSEDVIHSFWVPVLAGKLDAIPGKTNRLRLLASRPGRYAGACAEFCGIGHTGNRFVVVAHDPASWARLSGEAS